MEKESPEWVYVVEKFSQPPPKNKWLKRYRVSYFQQYINLKSFNRIFYNILLSYFWLFKHLTTTFKGSLFQSCRLVEEGQIVFFLSQNTTFLQHVVPIIEMYEKEGRNYIILCTGSEYDAVKKFILQFKVDSGKLTPVERIGKRELSSVFKWLVFPFLFTTDFIALAKLRLKNILWIPADFAKFSLVRHLYGKRIDEWIDKAGMLITASDHWMWESAMHETAKEKGIPNYVIQHGLIGDASYPLTGSHYCVWGEYYKRKMVNQMGAHESEVIVIGSGYFDRMYNDFRKLKAEKKYITFMSQPFAKTPLRLGPGIYEESVTWLNALQPLAKKYNLELLVKLHPRDREEFYPQLKNFSFTKDSLPEILSRSKIALTVSSTSIIEASLLDLPVIQLHHPLINTFYDLSKSGMSMIAHNPEEMYAMAERLLGDESAFRDAVEKTRQGQQQHFFRLGNSLDYFDEQIRGKKAAT